MNDSSPGIAVLGAGSWGTALSMQLARAGCRVNLWGRDAERIGRMRVEHRNPAYLTEFELPALISPEPSLELAFQWFDYQVVLRPGFHPQGRH